ncbi:MAG: VCBS repeat-containing protein, partial [Chlorobi bacterium]|nr:VCBS repeat-containing protein [Chlorobiota bacterium]
MAKLSFIIIILPFCLFGQNLHQRFEGIPFTINGISSVNPFNGGIEIPRYQFVNIDSDNDLDLFIYDKDTNLNFYRNEGSVSNGIFRLNTLRYQNLNIRNWFFFVDIDSDNDKDLFCGGDSQHVRYYKNLGTVSNPNFSLQTYALRTNLNEIVISEAASVPTFVDIDADGDFDFFTGSSSGKITFYENIGNQNNFNFKFVTDFYKGIEIIGGALNDPRHGASSITFVDIDGDNDRDL